MQQSSIFSTLLMRPAPMASPKLHTQRLLDRRLEMLCQQTHQLCSLLAVLHYGTLYPWLGQRRDQARHNIIRDSRIIR